MDKNELKILALRERISQLTTDYEDKIADLRVALTISEQEKLELVESLKEKNVSEDEKAS